MPKKKYNYGVPIRIKKRTRDALKKLGTLEDTYDTVIWRLIKK